MPRHSSKIIILTWVICLKPWWIYVSWENVREKRKRHRETRSNESELLNCHLTFKTKLIIFSPCFRKSAIYWTELSFTAAIWRVNAMTTLLEKLWKNYLTSSESSGSNKVSSSFQVVFAIQAIREHGWLLQMERYWGKE